MLGHESFYARIKASAVTSLLGAGLVVIAADGALAAGHSIAALDWLETAVGQWLAPIWAYLVVSVTRAFERQPAATLAVAGAAVVPLMAIAAGLVRTGQRFAARRAARAAAMARANASPEPRPAREAWIEQENRSGRRLRIGELTRIGRSEDCDLALGDSGLADMHAVIQRTADFQFIIIDVSASEGAGLVVNGHRMSQAPLRDGDRIEFGKSRVVFRQASVGSAPAAAAS